VFFQNHITPLHIASKWGHVEMVKLLVDSGCNVHTDTRVYMHHCYYVQQVQVSEIYSTRAMSAKCPIWGAWWEVPRWIEEVPAEGVGI